MENFFALFIWWFIYFLIGLTFLPLTTLIFSNFYDRGYAFAKILGVLLLGYCVWFLASLRILPFTTWGIYLILFLILIINLYFIFYKKTDINFNKFWKIFTFEEILFAFGLLFWGYIKSHEPSIQSLEKFMDFGFINSILRSSYFPPADMWMTPLSINYYYFGHYITALLTKISGFDSKITYNLMLVSLFALTLSASFSIGSNLYNIFFKNNFKFVSGLISAFLVTLGGNLQTIYAFFQTYVPAEKPVPFWQLKQILNFSDYWYPNATRFIPFTIHEFPIYSFVVSDLHGHVLNIPFVLLTIALLINFYINSKRETYIYILLGLLIAVMTMTNVLDGPIYLLLVSLVFFFKNLHDNTFVKSAVNTLKDLLPILVFAAVFSIPFWAAFKPFASGIGVLCPPQFLVEQKKLGPLLFEKDHCDRSPLWMLAIIWGFFYIVFTVFIVNTFKSFNKKKWTAAISQHHIIFILALFATLLFVIPEVVYVKDIYPAHYRANTLFKFGYQGFIVFALICGFMITYLLTQTKNNKRLINILILLPFILLVSLYPYFAINSYFGSLSNFQGLDGLKYLSNIYPSDYKAILWIKENIKNQPVILEAQGDSYTYYARVSANTGLPTVIGWPVHEWLWRGSYDEPGRRTGDVTTMYEDKDVDKTSALLKRYKVSYVFVGELEKEKYKNLDESKFQSLGKVVYQTDKTTIYKIN